MLHGPIRIRQIGMLECRYYSWLTALRPPDLNSWCYESPNHDHERQMKAAEMCSVRHVRLEETDSCIATVEILLQTAQYSSGHRQA